MSRPIQLDPANEKFFQSHVIAFHKPVQECTYSNIINQQLPAKNNKNEPELLQPSSVVVFKTELQKR